ncbi:hypothetical protein Dfri01_59070 [Dyadobacter frigoris]|uniref:hypothetical protein n=1 Tax=Dyadobacter frigoris TaxID=2576211 RepID=UPI0024A4FD40|nr:hypothetical protein [Dyadobacter frigoris]GLU56446.1 hypothetical protein Dfri01_59070 [Dyadobacter frigoris]
MKALAEDIKINPDGWDNVLSHLAWLLDSGYGDKPISQLLSDLRELASEETT